MHAPRQNLNQGKKKSEPAMISPGGILACHLRSIKVDCKLVLLLILAKATQFWSLCALLERKLPLKENATIVLQGQC